MSIIVLIPAFIAAYFSFTRSPNWAFINIYIPVLLGLPAYYAWHPPIIPDPNFNEATIIPIIIVFFMRNMPGWRFSFIDIIVLVFAFSTSYSEYTNYGYKEAQNLMANMILSVIFPYILAKSLIESGGLRVEAAKRIVLILFALSFIFVLENFFRSSYTVWQRVLGPFFNSGWNLVITPRWGLTRANGPFVHPIIAGIIMAVGFRLQLWLAWNNAWPTHLKKLPKLPLTIPQIITITLAVGLIAPLSRAPWIGSILAVVVVFSLAKLTGFSKKVATRYILVCATVVVLLAGWFIVEEAANEFAAVDRKSASEESTERQTIAYRFELYTTYGAIIMERWAWGWGRLGWPVDKAQPSIDNAFLLLGLNHGLIAVGCFIALFLGVIIKLFLHIVHQPAASPPTSAFSITLLSMIVVELFCLTTVSFYSANVPFLFIIFGWTESYLRSSKKYTQPIVTQNVQYKSSFRFRRVI